MGNFALQLELKKNAEQARTDTLVFIKTSNRILYIHMECKNLGSESKYPLNFLHKGIDF